MRRLPPPGPVPLSSLPPARLLSLLLVALLGLSGSALAGDEGPRQDPSRFLGSYGFAGGEPEARSLQGTIDALVARFNPLLRGIARRRLERSVRVPERIEIRTGDSGLRIDVVGAPDFPHEVRLESDSLVVRQSSFEGKRETRFRLSEDGRRLSMHVTTFSHLLPDLLDYELSFTRGLDAHEGQTAALVASPSPGS